MELVVVVSPRWRRIPRPPRQSHWGPPALRVLELPEIL